VRRVVPIAIYPFTAAAALDGYAPLSTFHLVAYVVTIAYFAHAEGYKGFQQKLAPLVVTRAFTLSADSPWHHHLLAPQYSSGLFYASKKRKIVSWCVTVGVAGIVIAVKKLPYPWRNIIDGGVIVGLGWGAIAIVVNYIKVMAGMPIRVVNAEMPESHAEKTKKK
jgi:hypothetical protein